MKLNPFDFVGDMLSENSKTSSMRVINVAVVTVCLLIMLKFAWAYVDRGTDISENWMILIVGALLTAMGLKVAQKKLEMKNGQPLPPGET